MQGAFDVEFAILGGGIAGLSTAVGLEKLGIAPVVFEAAPAFKPLGAGLVLAANAIKAYEYLGIHQQVMKAGHAMEHFEILRHSGSTIMSTAAEKQNGRWPGHSLHRADLHNVLLEQLQQTELHFGKRSIRVETYEQGKRIHFDDGSHVSAKYTIVAEGIHSELRKQMLPQSKERYAGYTCWRGVANGMAPNKDFATETWGPAGRFGIVPLTRNRVYWFAVKNAAQKSQTMKNYGKEDLLKNYEGYHSEVQATIASTRPEDIFWNDIEDIAPISEYAFGALLLLGDAAHATTPNMGQGACMAIEDAAMLSHCLSTEPSVTKAFTMFEKRRLKRARGIVNQSWQLGKIAQWENRWACALRNTMFRSVPKNLSKKRFAALADFRLDA